MILVREGMDGSWDILSSCKILQYQGEREDLVGLVVVVKAVFLR